ncbi:MAG: hypothetical protein IJY14_03810 [Acholeplasmatales bacterium]|nr:hypothetical protein [Acholeplasmatales bacterium]
MKRSPVYIAKILVATIISFIIIIFTILIINYGKNELGWFDDYDDWHKTEIHMPEPIEGGTVYLPNEWSLELQDDWLVIIDEDKKIIGIQIYKGFSYYDDKKEETIWVDYEENPILNNYGYNDLSFDSYEGGSNNCVLEKSQTYYKLSFVNMCSIENDPYKNVSYSLEFLIVGSNDTGILNKIRRSYSWGGHISGIY